MATNATAVWEVRTGGSASNGGGYDAGIAGAGTDYSQQNSAQATGTATSASTTLTATTGIFTSQMVGNAVTNGTTWAWITAFTSSTIVTLDSSPSWTSQTINVGGALSRPDTVLGTTPLAVVGNIVYIKNGTYTSTTTETIGADGGSSGYIYVVGYSSSRVLFNDETEANMPLFTSATNSIAIFTLNGATNLVFSNIKCTSTAATKGTGWLGITAASNGIRWRNCVVGTDSSNCCLVGWHLGTSSVNILNTSVLVGCTARFCSGTGASGAFICANANATVTLIGCNAHDNGACGYYWGVTVSSINAINMYGCIADSNAGDGVLIATTTTSITTSPSIINCVFYGNTLSGIHLKNISGNVRMNVLNCIFESNTRYALEGDTASVNDDTFLLKNAYYNNGSGNFLNINSASSIGTITLSGTAFTDAPNRNFSLNNTASAGALCRATSYPSYVGINGDVTRTYMDVGASQVIFPTIKPVGFSSIS